MWASLFFALVLAQAPNQLTGGDLYHAACAGCHGQDGTGSPEDIVGFDTPLPDFSDCGFSSVEADADWASVIREGGPVRAFDRRMPAFGRALSEEQIYSVVAYIRSICGETRWPRGELNLPRALVTEKAFPENEALMTTSVKRSPGAVSNVFLYEHRIGVRGQYEIAVPFDVRKPDVAGGWNRGLGDIAVAYKHVVLHSISSGSILSFGGEVVFPTAKDSDATVLEPFVAFGQILPRDAFLQVQAGTEHPLKRGHAAEAFGRLALGKTITQGLSGRAWSPMIEALAGRELESGHKVEWDLVPQMQVTLSKRQHIILNAGYRFPVNERSGRDKTFLIYLLWDWFDGGLFSGW